MEPLARLYKSRAGFSIVEMLIAIVFIMMSMLALLTAQVKVMQTNLENDIRNTATRIGNQTGEVLRMLPFEDDELSTAGSHVRSDSDSVQTNKGFPATIQTIRGSQLTFNVQWTVALRTNDLKQAEITVTYTSGANGSRTYTTMVNKHRE